VRIVKEGYPQAVEKGVLKVEGVQPTATIDVDATETEEVFGFKLKPFEEQVRGVLDWYVDLVGKEST